MKYILRLVVRRIVVGNLGTGNVERRFGEAARKVHDARTWATLANDLRDLNSSREEFVDQLKRRSFNKGVLSFLKRSIVAGSMTPDVNGVLHLIWTRQASSWEGMTEEDGTFWNSTLGNTLLSSLERRPKEIVNWQSFQENLLPYAIEHEWTTKLASLPRWDAISVERIGEELAEAAGNIWYP